MFILTLSIITCWDVGNAFRMERIFGSCFHLVVCRRRSCLIYKVVPNMLSIRITQRMCLIRNRNCSPFTTTWNYASCLEGSVLLVFLVFCVVFFVYFVFILCIACPILPRFLNCPFWTTPSVFSNIYFRLSIIL